MIVDTRFTELEEVLTMSGVEIKTGLRIQQEGAVFDKDMNRINLEAYYLDNWHYLSTISERWIYLGVTPNEILKTMEQLDEVKSKRVETSEGCNTVMDFIFQNEETQRQELDYFVTLPVLTIEYEEE